MQQTASSPAVANSHVRPVGARSADASPATMATPTAECSNSGGSIEAQSAQPASQAQPPHATNVQPAGRPKPLSKAASQRSASSKPPHVFRMMTAPQMQSIKTYQITQDQRERLLELVGSSLEPKDDVMTSLEPKEEAGEDAASPPAAASPAAAGSAGPAAAAGPPLPAAAAGSAPRAHHPSASQALQAPVPEECQTQTHPEITA